MAYRTFENEKTYAAPDIDILPKTLALLQSAQQTRQRQQQANRQLAANYQADKLNSNFGRDQLILTDHSRNLTQKMQNDLMRYGVPATETRLLQQKAVGDKNLSDAQWKMKEDLEAKSQNLTKYWDKDYFQSEITRAAYGNPDEDINLTNREPRLGEVANRIGNDYIHGYKIDTKLADYVKERGDQEHSIEKGYQSGAKESAKIKGAFFNDSLVHEVTPKHASEFLNSDPDVKNFYRQKMDLELLDDAKKMAATPEGAWIKDLPPEQQINVLRTDPRYNKDIGARENEMARKDLERHDQISTANSTDYTQHDPSQSERVRLGNTSKVFNVSQGNYDPGSYGGSGFVFTNNRTGTGATPGVTINIKGDAWDKNSKQQTGNRDAARDMNVTSANVGLVDSKGNPIDVPGKNVREQLEYLKKLPPEELNGLSLKTLIHGQSINGNSLSQARRKLQELQLKAGKTQAEETEMMTLENTLTQFDLDPNLAPEILQKNLGIVVEDLVKPVDPGSPEENQLSSKLGSFKVTDRKKWDSDMKEFADGFERIKKERAPEGFLRVQEKPLPNVKAKAKPNNAPAVGTKKGGYEFLGGDPSKAESWKKL